MAALTLNPNFEIPQTRNDVPVRQYNDMEQRTINAAADVDHRLLQAEPLQRQFLQSNETDPNGLPVRTEQAASPVFRDELTPQSIFKTLFPAYEQCNMSVQDMLEVVRTQNNSLEALRDFKQMLRNEQVQIGKDTISLNDRPELKQKWQECIKKHGLIAPLKDKFNASDLDALIKNIEDAFGNKNDIGEAKRLEIKLALSKGDIILRMLLDALHQLWELQKEITRR